MNEEELSFQFTKLHPVLKTYAEKALYVLASSLDSSAVLAECYINVHSRRGEFLTLDHLEAYSKKWIKQNIVWSRSPINLSLNRHQFYAEIDNASNVHAHTPLPPIAAWIKEWEASLPTNDRSLWYMYYSLEKNTTTKMKDHLGISKYITNKLQLIPRARALEESLKLHVLEKLNETL